jgi:hypothetical protein
MAAHHLDERRRIHQAQGRPMSLRTESASAAGRLVGLAYRSDSMRGAEAISPPFRTSSTACRVRSSSSGNR